MSKQVVRATFLREEKDPEIHSQNINFFGFISVSSFTHFLLWIALHTHKEEKKKKAHCQRGCQILMINNHCQGKRKLQARRRTGQEAPVWGAGVEGAGPPSPHWETTTKLRPYRNLLAARRRDRLACFLFLKTNFYFILAYSQMQILW